MTPELKAYSLFFEMLVSIDMSSGSSNRLENKIAAKSCAVLAAKEAYKEAYKQRNKIALIRQGYWSEVIKEIEKL